MGCSQWAKTGCESIRAVSTIFSSALHRLRCPVKVLVGHLLVVFLRDQPTVAQSLADGVHRGIVPPDPSLLMLASCATTSAKALLTTHTSRAAGTTFSPQILQRWHCHSCKIMAE